LLLAALILATGCTGEQKPDNAFALAAKHGEIAKVRKLLEEGVNVDAVDSRFHATALMWAAHEGHADIVQLLLDNGADIDARQELGRTALWYSAQQDRLGAARLLVAAGADIGLAANDGTTPHDIAVERGHRDVVDLLANAVNRETAY
jgi:ankyrin repeat protein